ncbi:hypothetical protein Tco_0537603 [Tanacetum coccineum]
MDILDEYLQSGNPDASKNNLVVMLYLLSEIQQSEYGLLEPRTLVCQNLVVGLLGHQQGLLYHTLYAQCVQGETHLSGGGTVDEDNESDDSLLVAKYARLICIYESLGKGVMTSGAERSSDRSSEGSNSVLESEEVFPDEAREYPVKPGCSP